MTDAKTDSDKALWITRRTAAAACRMSTRHFGEVIQARLPSTAIRGAGGTLRLWLPDIFKAYSAHQYQKERRCSWATAWWWANRPKE